MVEEVGLGRWRLFGVVDFGGFWILLEQCVAAVARILNLLLRRDFDVWLFVLDRRMYLSPDHV